MPEKPFHFTVPAGLAEFAGAFPGLTSSSAFQVVPPGLDIKGSAALPFDVMMLMTASQILFIPPPTCRKASWLLPMTKESWSAGKWLKCAHYAH
jgi:hypothetical protein